MAASVFSSLLNWTASYEQWASFQEWASQLPEGWVEHFVSQGLRPFLERFGYILPIGSEIEKRLLYWAWSYSFVYYAPPSRKYYVGTYDSLHSGGFEDLEYFLHVIDHDAWARFYERWSNNEWLDSSEVGYKQRIGFPNFIFSLLSLETSPVYLKYAGITDTGDSEKEEDAHPVKEDTDHAYGGDRRTY